MPYQAPITVKTALDRIWKHDYVLPAIQREFVWKPEQIYRLFDSLMQDFPIGSFLFWKIEPGTSKSFEFFDFSREYHQRDNPHCPRLGKVPDGTVTAVLDGQQRLTALNIGLRGSLAVKEPNKWRNNPKAFPVKRLYLNLLHEAKPDDEGEIYRFEFLTDERCAQPEVGEFLVPCASNFPDGRAICSDGISSGEETRKHDNRGENAPPLAAGRTQCARPKLLRGRETRTSKKSSASLYAQTAQERRCPTPTFSSQLQRRNGKETPAVRSIRSSMPSMTPVWDSTSPKISSSRQG